MDASVWVAKTGLTAQQRRMTVIANNGKRQHRCLQARQGRIRGSFIPEYPTAWRFC